MQNKKGDVKFENNEYFVYNGEYWVKYTGYESNAYTWGDYPSSTAIICNCGVDLVFGEKTNLEFHSVWCNKRQI